MKPMNYRPQGVMSGENVGPLTDKGTSTGFTGMDPHTMGMSLDDTATNSMGRITSATKSDPWDEGEVDDPTFGPAPGDAAEDAREGM